MKKLSLLLWGCCFFAGFVRAQESIVRERTSGEVIYVEAHYILSIEDSHTVIVPYRIRNDFFVFTRSANSATELFRAKADAVAEILDSTGNSIARRIETIDLSSETNSPAELRKNFKQGFMSFNLPQGKFTILFRVEDKESKRMSPDINRMLVIPASNDHINSSFIPVLRDHNGTPEFTMFNLSGDVLFSKNFGFLFVSDRNDLSTARYSIQQITGEDKSDREKISDTTVQCISFKASKPHFQKQNGSIIAALHPTDQLNAYFIPVNGEQLRQGRYEISLTINDLPASKILFATRWLDMPVSLTDLDIATYPLQYLLTEDDYSTLRRGSRETRIQKFEEFWKKKDPTPATAMNEMMTEFYRRVDHSIGAFRTLKEPNGSLTDRGKIYILYGKPTSTERSLYPNSTPKEVWKYENLKKTFVFEDQSKQGNYKLAESK
ncbi:MAG: GWxTD domain-containing protein [Ignavibacteriales bacterium]|nr:GWxTD domain-containing protein [Ignavibacteriales bacterium]